MRPNGAPHMLTGAVQAAVIAALLDAVLSVDAVRLYKPRPEVYALVTDAFACKPEEVAFVSSNRWDVMGALVCLAGVAVIMYAPRGG